MWARFTHETSPLIYAHSIIDPPLFILYNSRNMNKKVIILLLSLFIILVTTLFFFLNRTSDNQKTGQEIYQMTRGTIVELKLDGSVVVEGEVGSERKQVEFALTPQTILNNNVSIFPTEIPDGEIFQPKTEIRPGKQSDFAINLSISKIESREDLSGADKATAIEINYSTDEF